MSKSAKGAVLGFLTVAILAAGCNRSRIEAVEKAQEGDNASSAPAKIKAYAQAAELDPDNHLILYKLAVAYQSQKDWQNVSNYCAKAEQGDAKQNKQATHADYFFLEGVAHQQLAKTKPEELELAEKRYRQTLELDPAYSDAYWHLGEILALKDDEEGALKNFTEAIRKKPDKLAYYISLSEMYKRLNYLKEAIDVANQGLEFAKEAKEQPKDESDEEEEGPKVEEPNYAYALHSRLGSFQQLLAKPDDALKEFELARKACQPADCSKNIEINFQLGIAYGQLKQPDREKAVAALKQFCKAAACGKNPKKELTEKCVVAAGETQRLNKATCP